MRRCRKLISVIVMMAMLATMTPYQALATETPTVPAVQEVQPTAEEEGQEQVQEPEEGEDLSEDQKNPEEGQETPEDQETPEENKEAALSEDSSEVTPESNAADNRSTEAVVGNEDPENGGEGKSGQNAQEIAAPEEPGSETPADPVQEEKKAELKEGSIEAEAGGFTVKAEGKLPEGAELVLTKLSDSTVEEVGKGLDKENQTAVFAYDVTIKDAEGKIWQPEELGVKISISGLDLENKVEVSVAHILDKEEAVEAAVSNDSVKSEEVSLSSGAAVELKTAVEAAGSGDSVVVTTITEDAGLDVKDSAVSFDVDSFSAFIVFTVDFEYGEYTYSIGGKESILLSELFAALKIEQPMAEITSVEWEAREGYDPNELISIEKQEGDWNLNSLKAFDTEETLIVKVEDLKEYRIKVTDDEIVKPFVTYDLNWITVEDDYNTYEDDHNTLVSTPPKGSDMYQAKLQIYFKFNAAETQQLPEGSVSFKIPKYIFENWQGDGNVAMQNNGYWGASIEWQVPKAPTVASTSDFNYVESEDGLYYIMSNVGPIKGDVTLYCDVAYQYQPLAIKVDENGVFRNDDVSIEMTVKADEFEIDTTETKTKSVEVHTKTVPTSITKQQDGKNGTETDKFLAWQSAWGEKPEDADDYFYIYWNIVVKRNYGNTMPFDIVLNELNTTVDIAGEEPVVFDNPEDYVVGVTYYQTYYSDHTIGFFANSAKPSTNGISGRDWSLRPGIKIPYNRMGTDPQNSGTKGDWSASARWGVLTRYPKSLFKDALENGMTREQLSGTGLKITNTASVTNEQANGGTVDGNTSTATTYFRLATGDGAGVGFSKSNAGTGGFVGQAGAADVLLEASTPYRIGYNGANAEAFAITGELNPTQTPLPGENGEAYISPYTFTLTDGSMYLTPQTTTASQQGAGDCTTWEDNEPVQDGDVVIDGITLSLTSYKAGYVEVGDGEIMVSTGAAFTSENLNPIKVYVRRIGESDYSLYGSLKLNANGSSFTFTRDEGCTDGVASANVSRGTGYSGSSFLTMPANTVSFKIEHTSTAYKGTVNVDMRVTLRPTEHMKEVLAYAKEKNVNTVFTNHAFYECKDELSGQVESGQVKTSGGNDRTQSHTLNRANARFGATKTKIVDSTCVDEPANARQYVQVACWATISSGINLDSNIGELQRLVNPETGFYFDLLPPGCTVDTSSVHVRFSASESTIWNGGMERSRYDVKVERNWNNTGRDLLIVELLDNIDWSTANTAGGYAMTYNMYNSYANIDDRGSVVTNVFGFVNTDEGASKLKPTSAKITSLGSQKDAMTAVMEAMKEEYGWDDDYLDSHAVYAQANYNYRTIGVRQTGYNKYVSTDLDTEYRKANKSLIGDDYSYYISYVQNPNTVSDTLVLFDELDKGSFLTTQETEWQGYFKSLDVSLIDGKPNHKDSEATCDPVVWYATGSPSESDMTIEGLDSNSNGIWTQTLPDDPSTVKAFAVDCRKDSKGNDYYLPEGGSMSLYVYMTSPYDKELKNKWAVNGTKLFHSVGSTVSEISTPNVSDAYCSLMLLDPNLELHKSSDPETGTAEAPTLVPVNSTLTYTLTLSVGDEEHDVDYTLHDIVVTDPIPEGLTVNASNIRYYTDSNAARQTLGSNKRARVEQDGQNLTFTVREMSKGEIIYLEIPTTVQELKDANGNYIARRDFINTATLESYDDHEVDEDTETMYHYASNGYLAISKTVVSPVPAEANKVFTFTVELTGEGTDGEYGTVTTDAAGTETKSTVTFTNGTATVTVAGGSTLTIQGLPPKTGYKVTETTDPNFTVDPVSAEAAGTIEVDTTSEAAFTNTRKTGNLAISKTVVTPIEAEENKEFTFTVMPDGITLSGDFDAVRKAADGTETEETVTFTDNKATVTVAGGETLTIKGLPSAVTYTVTETTDANFTVDSASKDVAVAANDTGTAAFTNTRKLGNLAISKTVVSPIAAEANKVFTFDVVPKDITLSGDFAAVRKSADGTEKDETVTFAENKATVTVAGGETLTIKGLPSAVTYTVTETTDANFTVDSASKDVAVAANDTGTAAFTNTRKLGNLAISKTVVSPIPAERTQEFTFTVVPNDVTLSGEFDAVRTAKGSEDKKEKVTFAENKATVTVAGGETLTIKGLPSAVTYTVTETTDANFIVDPESAATDAEVETDATTAAAFTNTRKTGNLSVTKEVINKNDTNTAKEFEITVTLDNDTIEGEFGEEGTSMTFEKGVATFKLKDGETKIATGLPSGIGYTVVETADDGFVTRYENVTEEADDTGDGTDGQTDGEPAEGDEEETGDETEGISGTIVVDETKSVKVINTYLTEGEYAVEVKKVLEGRLLREGQFEFELSDSEGEVLQTVKNDLDGNVKFEPIAYTVDDLDKETEGERAGYIKDETIFTYTVKEVIPEGAKDNGDGTFTLDGYTYDAVERTITLTLKDNGEGTINVEADKKIEDLTFTNIYAADGEVFIGGVKVLEGQDLKEGQFKFVLSDESGKKVLEATNDANGNFEFEGIKYELADLDGETEKVFSYGVTEINDGQNNITYDKTAYTVKVTVTDNGDGTLTAKADKSRGEIRFTNKYTPPETPKEDKPKHKKSNNTGDSANGALWALMLLLAGGALAGTIWFRRRKKV